jgi:hypothetical protein
MTSGNGVVADTDRARPALLQQEADTFAKYSTVVETAENDSEWSNVVASSRVTKKVLKRCLSRATRSQFDPFRATS